MQPIHFTARSHQTGAALVVGLVLLVALTLLALASMNTASLDLIMTGNEQYRARVFEGAETGIQTAYMNYDLFTTAGQMSSSGTAATGETYNYTVTPYNCGQELNLPGGDETSTAAGSGGPTYQAVYFTIVSNGTSTRGSATNIQGIQYKVQDSGSFTDINNTGCSSSSASSSSSVGLY